MQTEPLIPADMRSFLETTARAVLDTCSVAPGAACGSGVNTLGFRAITPGGYPAVWIQDFTMNFSSGLLEREVGLNHLRLILEKQNGEEAQELGSGVIVPPHAIADHINLNGEPVFFPGTYDPIAHQEGAWGFRPPTNNYYDVIWLAHMLATSGDAVALLNGSVNGKTVYERLQLAFGVPEIDPATQLVHTTAERRVVGFIFCDSICMTGDLLMASLLRHRAAGHLAFFAESLEQAHVESQDSARARAERPPHLKAAPNCGIVLSKDAETYTAIAGQIAQNIQPVFGRDAHSGGWLKAATEISGQPDVWGSMYAIYRGIIQGEAKEQLLRTIVRALDKDGEIEFQGALRHVPVSLSASAASAWERTATPGNRYQNGAYWHTPVGWLLAILEDGHPEHARAIRDRWLAHLKAEQGRVWECIGWGGEANQNSGFAPSITQPLGVLG
ncbi:MAG: hypothetical protein ACOYOU_15790 [Kiritimatiellia bacterium]